MTWLKRKSEKDAFVQKVDVSTTDDGSVISVISQLQRRNGIRVLFGLVLSILPFFGAKATTVVDCFKSKERNVANIPSGAAGFSGIVLKRSDYNECMAQYAMTPPPPPAPVVVVKTLFSKAKSSY